LRPPASGSIVGALVARSRLLTGASAAGSARGSNDDAATRRTADEIAMLRSACGSGSSPCGSHPRFCSWSAYSRRRCSTSCELSSPRLSSAPLRDRGRAGLVMGYLGQYRRGGGRPQSTSLRLACSPNESAPSTGALPKVTGQAAIAIGFASRSLLELAIARGFMASGTSRRRPTFRSPFSRVAVLTPTWSASWKLRTNVRAAMPW
jgi:hypothetical protein